MLRTIQEFRLDRLRRSFNQHYAQVVNPRGIFKHELSRIKVLPEKESHLSDFLGQFTPLQSVFIPLTDAEIHKKAEMEAQRIEAQKNWYTSMNALTLKDF